MNTPVSNAIVVALTEDARKLLAANWWELWSLRTPNRPLRIAVVHTVDDTGGTFRLQSSVTVSTRLTFAAAAREPDLSSEAKSSKVPLRVVANSAAA